MGKKSASARFGAVLEAEVEIISELNVSKEWDRLMSIAIDEWTTLSRQGFDDAEIESQLRSILEGLSEKPEQDLSRKASSVSYNQGRSAEILTAAASGEATHVVRSEILDENTCAQCERLDGYVAEIGTPEFDQFMPPAYCEGGDRCRGFYIAFSGGANA